MENVLANLGSPTPDQTTSIQIFAVVGNQLQVQFTGMPSNQPNNYGNYLAVWKNQNTIPWNSAAADGYVAVQGNSSQSGQVFENIKVEVGVSYVVGYAVGPKLTGAMQVWGNICTSGFVPASGDSTYLSPSLSNVLALSNSVSMNFQLPFGATPKTNGAWVGIWQTGQPSYTVQPMGSNIIGLDSSQGGAAINGISILRSQIYTVALFASGYKAGAGGVHVLTAMTCSSTFTT
jgi:hypothetical protein